MKVLYHHRTASRDGQAVHIDEMVQALRELGHEVRVVAPMERHQADTEGDRMGQRMGWVHRLKSRLPPAVYEVLELGYSAVAWWRLRAAVRQFRPDALYERYNLFMLAGAWVARTHGLPYLLEVNAPLAEERLRFGGLALPALARWCERRVWRRADRVFVVTAVLGRMVQAQGVEPHRIIVTPNGINPRHFAQAPTPEQARTALGWEGSLVLGFTGFVRAWHGVDRVIRWLASEGAPPHVRLLVVGDGPARAELERLAAQLGLQARVRFTGVVPRATVPSLVAAFDVALQPAVVPYASPLKLFEYLALGKAIVAPRQPNIEEVLHDGRNALLFDEGQPGSLEAALQRLVADAALRQRLSEAAARTVTERELTWQHNADMAVQAARGVALGHEPGQHRWA